MKRMIVGMTAATLMSGGLVAASTGAADAACPYTGCVDTNTNIFAPNQVKRGNTANVCVAVSTDGSGRPKGKVTVVVKRKKNVVLRETRAYNENRECFQTAPMNKRGKYTVTANFKKKKGSAFRNSGSSTTIKVVKKGR